MLAIVQFGVMREECGCRNWEEAYPTLQWDFIKFHARAMGGH
jgi:hypothetical protein